MRARVFVGFFGLVRSLELTIGSIERQIFRPLSDAGAEVVCAAHLNRPATIHSPRSGEHNIPFSMPDIGRLRLSHHVIEDQAEHSIASYLPDILSLPQRNEDDADQVMRRNALFQLYSLKRLGQIFSAIDPASFDLAIILRPDLQYVDPLPLAKLFAQIKGCRIETAQPNGSIFHGLRRRLHTPVDIVMPSWHKAHGLNDRFAIATPSAAAVYFNRLDQLSDYRAVRSHFQSELLLDFVIRRAGLTAGETWMRANRIRADGRTEIRDLRPRETRLSSALRPLRMGLQV